MTPVFAARRRAEEFSSLVEDTSTDELRDAPYADLLALVGDLRQVAPVEPRPAFVSDLRAQLMAAAESVLAPDTDTDAQVAARLTVAPRRTKSERRLATAIGGFAIVGATASMAVAAQSALPGDTLYPLKRAIENAKAGVQVDDEDKGVALLANASGRLAEIGELSRRGDASDADAVAETLQIFTDQATEASDLLLSDYEETGRSSSIDDLRSFTSSSMESLSVLESLVPESARGSLIQAAQTLTQIDEQALSLCPSCGEGDLAQVPQFASATIDSLAELLAGAQASSNEGPAPSNTGAGDAQGDVKQRPGGSTDSDAGSGDEPSKDAEVSDLDPKTPGLPDAGSDKEQGDKQKGPLGGLAEGLTGGGKGRTTDSADLDDVLKDVADSDVSGLNDKLLP